MRRAGRHRWRQRAWQDHGDGKHAPVFDDAVAGCGGRSGGFSFYDHVFLPESVKDLIWAHDGRRYRSQVVIRLDGRRRTEAFLLVAADEGAGSRWSWPTAPCPTARSPLTTVASKRSAAARTPSSRRCFRRRASGIERLQERRDQDIARRLAGAGRNPGAGPAGGRDGASAQAGLAAIRQEQAGLDAEAQRIEGERRRLDGAQARVAQRLAGRQATQAAQESVEPGTRN